MRTRFGFSTLELIVVLAVFAITASTTLPFLGRFQEHATAQSVEEDIVAALRGAGQRALAGEDDSDAGVAFEDGAYVTYVGMDASDRREERDRRHVLPPSLRLQGDRDVSFLRGTGMSRFGSRTVILTELDVPRATIFITEAGAVFLQP